MGVIDLLKPLVVFVLVIVLILGGTAALGASTSGDGPAPDGRNVDGQSPDDWQPDSVLAESDAEEGSIEVAANADEKRILVDTRHENDFERSDLEPLVTALFREEHVVRFQGSSDESEFGSAGYNETLRGFDAVLVIAPTESFSEEETAGLTAFARGGGRVVVLNEPTQNAVSGGLLSSSVVAQQYTGDDLTEKFDMRVGDGILYNIDDERNDNNFKSIHADAARSGGLLAGVDRVSLDTAGKVVTRDGTALLTAVEGTTQLETRRTGEYTIAARNGNLVLVADSSFIETSELYDADNEQFVSNLLGFLVSGDKPDDVPGGDDDGFGDDDEPTPDEPPRTTVAG